MLKLKKNNSGAKRLIEGADLVTFKNISLKLGVLEKKDAELYHISDINRKIQYTNGLPFVWKTEIYFLWTHNYE